jgi:large subunit ribosomal protein L35
MTARAAPEETSRHIREARMRRRPVPKTKTRRGAKKRFRITGTGKVMRERTNMQHKFEEKSSTRIRRLSMDVTLAPADTKKIKRLLGR